MGGSGGGSDGGFGGGSGGNFGMNYPGSGVDFSGVNDPRRRGSGGSAGGGAPNSVGYRRVSCGGVVLPCHTPNQPYQVTGNE